MGNFGDRMVDAVERKSSCVVAGLDPRIDSLPDALRARAAKSRADAAQAILDFNLAVLDAVAPHCVAVKPQSAFYEALGWEGVRAYAETVRAARERDLIVIGDVKRGDIGSTAEAYAEGHLDLFQSDSVTVNPYLGIDGIAPFLKRAEAGQGVFVLVKTSNPSSVELQDLESGGRPIYEHVAALVHTWGEKSVGRSGYSAAGAVVGATFPEAAARLRGMMPNAIFLVPGYGAQGATARDCRPCFDARGRGAVVNSSRGIIFAYGKNGGASWAQAVRDAARKMQQELEAVRKT
jgi:orotidine-5'-phosphate decarboxylase